MTNKKFFEEARDDFDQAIRLQPKCAEAFYGRGFANNNLGNQDGAIADFKRAIEL